MTLINFVRKTADLFGGFELFEASLGIDVSREKRLTIEIVWIGSRPEH